MPLRRCAKKRELNTSRLEFHGISGECSGEQTGRLADAAQFMRGGWRPEACWFWFDAGPWGTGHQHYEKLHLSVSAFGRELLVDAGRFNYKRDGWRRFFQGTWAHNTILIDGHGQDAGPNEAAEPLAPTACDVGGERV